MKMLPFELKKLFFSKKYMYIMLLIIIGVSALFLRNVSLQSYIQNEERAEIEHFLSVSLDNSAIHQAKLEKDPDNETEKKLQRTNSAMIETLYSMRSASVTNDWKNKLTLENQFLDDTAAYQNEGGEYPLTNKEITHQIALNQKLLDKEIAPEHEKYSLALPNFLKLVIDILIQLGALIIVILFIAEMMTAEFETGSVYLLFTQPLQRGRIISSKFWTSVITYVTAVVVIIITAILMGRIFGNKGTFDYPVVFERNGNIDYLTITEYMTQALVVATVTIIMVISLYLLYSVLIKQTIATIFVFAVTLLAGYGLTLIISWPVFAWINPFQYLLPVDAILNQNDSVWFQGIPVTVLLTVIFYVLSVIRMKLIKSG